MAVFFLLFLKCSQKVPVTMVPLHPHLSSQQYTSEFSIMIRLNLLSSEGINMHIFSVLYMESCVSISSSSKVQ